jgi:hypothetical protein
MVISIRNGQAFVVSEVRFANWDRCYDFLNIFAKKFSEKIGVFVSKQSQNLKKSLS